jgi:hypothetical protein
MSALCQPRFQHVMCTLSRTVHLPDAGTMTLYMGKGGMGSSQHEMLYGDKWESRLQYNRTLYVYKSNSNKAKKHRQILCIWNELVGWGLAHTQSYLGLLLYLKQL